MEKNVAWSLIISLVLVGGALYMARDVSISSSGIQAGNVEVRDGVQYVTITAKGGYSPRVSQIKAGVPTKLRIKTNGTYDCSSALIVRATGFQKILQPTGEEVIDIGTPKTGDKVQGVCSMGMYSFVVQAR